MISSTTIDLERINRSTFRLSPRGPVVMRAVGPTLSSQIQMERVVTAILREAAAICRDDILPQVPDARAEIAAVDSDFDPSEHPRGQGGRFSEKPDNGDPFLARWGKVRHELTAAQIKELGVTVGILDHVDRAALKKYAEAFHGDALNSELRSGKGSTINVTDTRLLEKLDRAFQKTPGVPFDLSVYRGFGPDLDEILNRLKPGDIFVDHAFVSTSIEEKSAAEFGTGPMMHIHVPKGAKAIYVGVLHSNSAEHEKELLLNRGTRLKYLGKVGNHHEFQYVLTSDFQVQDNLSRLARELDRFRQFLEAHGISVTPKIAAILRVEEAKHRSAFITALKSAFGIDASVIFSQGDTAAQVRVAAEASASLIKGLTDDLAKRVANTVLDGARKGTRSKTLAEELQRIFKISNRRAKLIARDQLASFNSSLNKARQKQVGIKKYVWSTSLDERVRGNPSGKYPNAIPSHWARRARPSPGPDHLAMVIQEKQSTVDAWQER